MLRESESLEEQGDILQYLVDTQGLDFNTGKRATMDWARQSGRVSFVVALIYWPYLTIYDWIPQPTGTIINIVTLSSVKLIEIDRRRPQFVFYIL